ncbi:hypothetical protein BBK36DRAFT_1158568 [Trichoderma citrinoviride]|uniref:Uncharacterized protein n=1 Tax=Trichoderma citrinoviride TaxID=58853 RepID=A0A2T4BEI3_9HYPO|nr:hypothetical protein BBK36DRAFT_1158568 [Trichoderma citrinoviride]PTB67744.1 hypothetical protein BBK36DRAFT_1158568 [Trichoderma citrinoviride]
MTEIIVTPSRNKTVGIMKFIWATLLVAASSAFASPVAEANAGGAPKPDPGKPGYGDYGKYGEYGRYADYGKYNPPKGGYGDYKKYPEPKGGYGDYGKYPRE